MKKLIIAAAIVCAAVVSQAASFKWTDAGLVGIDGKGTYAGNGNVMIYICAKGDTSSVVETFSTAMNNGALDYTGVLKAAEVGTTYTFYYTIADGDATWTSVTKNKKITDPSIASVDFAGSGSWQTVPEPTSGLLLLLGVVGLALRRKQK